MSFAMFTFVTYRISMVFLLTFQMSFLVPRYSRAKSIMIAAACLIITSATDYVQLFCIQDGSWDVPKTLVQAAIVQLNAMLLSRHRDSRALFIGLTSAAYVMPGDVLSLVVATYTDSYAVAITMQIAVHLMLMIIFITQLRKPFMGDIVNDKHGWGIMCAVPTLFYCLIYALAIWPSNIKKSPQNGLAALLALILLAVTYILVVKLFDKTRAENELMRSNDVLETYASGLRHEAETVRKAEEEMAVMRHDTRHSIAMLQTYLEAGDMDSMRKMLEQVNIRLDTTVARHYCDNIAVNGIISGCVNRASGLGIKVTCIADVPRDMESINEFELGTVISNLLENAINASAEITGDAKRGVYVRMFRIKGQFMLEVKNSYEGELELSPETGLPVSHRGAGHGYGMRSVKAYAEKTGAILQCMPDNGQFCVRLLVPMHPVDEDEKIPQTAV